MRLDQGRFTMNTRLFNQRSQAGTGLIEVLVAILVLAVGILGMSKIHGLLIRDGGTANNHAIAVSLAQEKLDDLRGFKWLNVATSYGENCGAGIFCYSEIATNLGGYEATGTGILRFPSGTITVGNTSFNRTWTVVDNGSFKLATATVTWTDQNGAASEILQSAIVADDPGTNAFGATNSTITVAGPKVPYTPKAVPDVVPITISDGTKRETSKPLPDVSSKGLSVSSQFSSVNYKSDGEQSQEDFVTLNCTCQFAASVASNPASYYTYVNGKLIVKYPKLTTDKVNKISGSAITSQGDSQDPLCNTCCADHHDKENANASSATTALFDPERPSSDYAASGNHKHYYYSNANNPNLGLVEVAETSGNTYLEACRFLRVDGIYRIMQDWRLSDVTVMPKDDYLATGNTALSIYQTYVGDVAKAQAKTDGGTNTTWNKLGLSTRDLSSQAAGTYIQLLARGIYVDKVYSAPRTLDSTYYAGIVSGTIGLDSISFDEVNVTLLAQWASSNTSVATVTNDAIKDIASATSDYYGVYNRGRVAVLSGTGNNANITAYVLPSNSGLTGGSTRATYTSTVDYDRSSLTPSGTIAYSSEIGVDRHDHSSALRKSDSLNIARAGSASSGSHTVSGTLQLGNYSGVLTNVSVSGSPSVTSCTVATPTGNTSTFSCSVLDTYAGTLTVATSQTGGFVTGSTCTLTAGSASVGCGSYSVYGPYMYVSGSCTGTGQSCSSNKLSITAGTGSTCTNGNSPQCSVLLNSITHTWTGTITATDTGNNAKVQIGESGTTQTCSTGSGSASLTISSAIGPADAQSRFVMCDK